MKLSFSHEFRLRYMSGYFRFQEHSRAEKRWAKFIEFTHDPDGIASSDMVNKMKVDVNCWDDEHKKWKAYTIDLGKVILDFTFPEIGYMNMEYGIRYLERQPMRQWNRLLRSSVVSANLYSGIHDIVPSKEANSSFEPSIIQLLTSQYPSFQEAVQFIVDGDRVATAFSKDYAVTLSPQSKKKLWVLLKDGPIGVVDKVDDKYVIAIPPSMEYVIEDLMQYADTACYF